MIVALASAYASSGKACSKNNATCTPSGLVKALNGSCVNANVLSLGKCNFLFKKVKPFNPLHNGNLFNQYFHVAIVDGKPEILSSYKFIEEALASLK